MNRNLKEVRRNLEELNDRIIVLLEGHEAILQQTVSFDICHTH
jgi:hypothetical protein